MRKMQVEDCRTLCVFQLAKDGKFRPSAKTAGVKTWSTSGLLGMFAPKPFSIAYEVFPTEPYMFAVRLSFGLSGQSVALRSLFTPQQLSREIEQTIPVVSTQPHYGGHRFWFLCPWCDCRIAKVYLPETGQGFACRRCHNLTYRSSQTAHEYDTIYRELAPELGCSIKDARRKLIDRFGSFGPVLLELMKSTKELEASINSMGSKPTKIN